eukprot:COSAG01_NODE_4314_length_5139_cov_22.559413_5_plen_196_part_00
MSDEAKDRECEFRAKDAKERGNDALAEGNAHSAVQFYTTAINLNYKPEMHVFYSNRSAAYAKLGKFDLALADGERCVLVKPDWAKGYFRKGSALLGLRRPAEAVQAFRVGLSVEPNNAGLKAALERAAGAERAAAADYEDEQPANCELHEACRSGNLQLAQSLLTAGDEDVQQRDREGNTALHYAAWENHVEVAR